MRCAAHHQCSQKKVSEALHRLATQFENCMPDIACCYMILGNGVTHLVGLVEVMLSL
jgi:hypothetical protein